MFVCSNFSSNNYPTLLDPFELFFGERLDDVDWFKCLIKQLSNIVGPTLLDSFELFFVNI